MYPQVFVSWRQHFVYNINAMLYWFAMNQCQNNATSCFNTYQMQDLIYIESMLVICPFDIAAFHRIILMLW